MLSMGHRYPWDVIYGPSIPLVRVVWPTSVLPGPRVQIALIESLFYYGIYPEGRPAQQPCDVRAAHAVQARSGLRPGLDSIGWRSVALGQSEARRDAGRAGTSRAGTSRAGAHAVRAACGHSDLPYPR